MSRFHRIITAVLLSLIALPTFAATLGVYVSQSYYIDVDAKPNDVVELFLVADLGADSAQLLDFAYSLPEGFEVVSELLLIPGAFDQDTSSCEFLIELPACTELVGPTPIAHVRLRVTSEHPSQDVAICFGPRLESTFAYPAAGALGCNGSVIEFNPVDNGNGYDRPDGCAMIRWNSSVATSASSWGQLKGRF